MTYITDEELLKDVINERENDEVTYRRYKELELLYSALAVVEKETITHWVYWAFSEYASKGYSIMVQDIELTSTFNSDWVFMCTVELPPVDKNKVVEFGVRDLDNKIIDKKQDIMHLEEKKQQLLALENHSGS